MDMSAIGWGNDCIQVKLSHKCIVTGFNYRGWKYNKCNFSYCEQYFVAVDVCPPLGLIKWVCYPLYTHTNPWGRSKWPYAITRLTALFMCGLMSALVICNFRKSIVIHDTECLYWDQVPLNNTKPTNQISPNVCPINTWNTFCCIHNTAYFCPYWLNNKYYTSHWKKLVFWHWNVNKRSIKTSNTCPRFRHTCWWYTKSVTLKQ